MSHLPALTNQAPPADLFAAALAAAETALARAAAAAADGRASEAEAEAKLAERLVKTLEAVRAARTELAAAAEDEGAVHDALIAKLNRLIAAEPAPENGG